VIVLTVNAGRSSLRLAAFFEQDKIKITIGKRPFSRQLAGSRGNSGDLSEEPEMRQPWRTASSMADRASRRRAGATTR